MKNGVEVTKIIASRQRFGPLVMLVIFVTMTLGMASKQANGADLSSSIYYQVFGALVFPIFYASALVVLIGLFRVVLISHEWIRIADDKLVVGLKKPIDRDGIRTITIVDKKLQIVLKTSRVISTSVSMLNVNGDELLEELESWRACH